MIIFNSSMTHQCRFPGFFFDHVKMTSNNKSSHRCAQNMLYMKTHLLKEHIYFIGYNYTYYQKRPPIHVNTYQCSFMFVKSEESDLKNCTYRGGIVQLSHITVHITRCFRVRSGRSDEACGGGLEKNL